MYYIFNKTETGYRHLRENKPCQDYSASYSDKERMIITCCDGHGGDIYIRSDRGSKFASKAIINVFSSLKYSPLRKDDKAIKNIKLSILCEWNRLVEEDLARRPIRKKELEHLDEDKLDRIIFNKVRAYGTTLSGAMVYKNKIIVVSIGDTEALGVYKGKIIKIFDDENDPVANVTYSMCQEDAFNYLNVRIMNVNELDGLFLCTDGLSAPFAFYDSFKEGFIKPSMREVINSGNLEYFDQFVSRLAKEKGVGDDVSLAFIINSKAKIKYYKK